MRVAFPDFLAELHWHLADEDRVTTYKTNHETHDGEFRGIAPTHREIHFETVDVMRVQTVKAPTIRASAIYSHSCDRVADARRKPKHKRS